MFRRSTLALAMAAALTFPALTARAASDLCSSAGSVQDVLNDLLTKSDAFTADGEKAKQEAEAQNKKNSTATQEELCSRTGADGLGVGRIDFLCRAFFALDLGEIEDNNGSLIFNFSPETFGTDLAGRFAPKVVVHEPTVFAPLEAQLGTLPENIRQDRKDTTKKGLEDLDDVELALRWTHQAAPAREVIEAQAANLFQTAYAEFEGEFGSFASRTAEFSGRAKSLRADRARAMGREVEPQAELVVSDICAPIDDTVPAALAVRAAAVKAEFLALTGWIEESAPDLLSRLRDRLSRDSYFALADLFEGEPRLVLDGSYRRRGGAAGPDAQVYSLKAEVGAISYTGFKRWARRQGKELTASSFQDYYARRGAITASTLPAFSLTAEYEDTGPFTFLLPADGFRFHQDGGTRKAAALHAGLYLGGTRSSRLDLEAEYEDVTGDDSRNDRLVATLTWSQTLTPELAELAGGSKLAVSLVWASKPEYRGEVDEELSLRAGLKWSLGGKKERGL